MYPSEESVEIQAPRGLPPRVRDHRAEPGRRNIVKTAGCHDRTAGERNKKQRGNHGSFRLYEIHHQGQLNQLVEGCWLCSRSVVSDS